MEVHLIRAVFSFLIPAVYSDIARWNSGFSASFEVINNGRMYETLTPPLQLGVYACAMQCIHYSECVTINHNDKKDLCELVGQKYNEWEADTSDPHWKNYGTPDKIDGNFTAWKKIGACSVTCESGMQMEQRSCDNPQPRFGGKSCEGETVRQVECNTNIPCPIPGSWTSWVQSGFCSSCTKKRTCSAPSPKHNGQECLQSDGITRSLEEVITPCVPCNISEYVQCKYVRQVNVFDNDVIWKIKIKSDQECIEFCYEQKKTSPEIVGFVTKNDGSGECFCKSGSKTTGNPRFKLCEFEEVNLALPRNAASVTTSITDRGDPSWWMVEVKSSIVLKEIKLTLSSNSTSYENLKIKTKIAQDELWKPCESIDPVSINVNVKCDDDETKMKYLRVENSGQLILHEVQVYGWPSSLP